MVINKQRSESALSTFNQDNMGDYYLVEFTSLLAFVLFFVRPNVTQRLEQY